jgi:hypothetical protein
LRIASKRTLITDSVARTEAYDADDRKQSLAERSLAQLDLRAERSACWKKAPGNRSVNHGFGHASLTRFAERTAGDQPHTHASLSRLTGVWGCVRRPRRLVMPVTCYRAFKLIGEQFRGLVLEHYAMSHRSANAKREFGPVNRAVAGLLALVWLGAGGAAVVFAIAQHRWWMLALGVLAVGYGTMWIRVAQTGARLRWPRRTS